MLARDNGIVATSHSSSTNIDQGAVMQSSQVCVVIISSFSSLPYTNFVIQTNMSQNQPQGVIETPAQASENGAAVVSTPYTYISQPMEENHVKNTVSALSFVLLTFTNSVRYDKLPQYQPQDVICTAADGHSVGTNLCPSSAKAGQPIEAPTPQIGIVSILSFVALSFTDFVLQTKLVQGQSAIGTSTDDPNVIADSYPSSTNASQLEEPQRNRISSASILSFAPLVYADSAL